MASTKDRNLQKPPLDSTRIEIPFVLVCEFLMAFLMKIFFLFQETLAVFPKILNENFIV